MYFKTIKLKKVCDCSVNDTLIFYLWRDVASFGVTVRVRAQFVFTDSNCCPVINSLEINFTTHKLYLDIQQ